MTDINESTRAGQPVDIVSDSDLVSAFRSAAVRYAEHTALCFGMNDTLSFRSVDTMSDRLAAGLIDQGIVAGDRIALYAPNRPEFCLAYLAILKAGACVVPINCLLSSEEIAYILQDAEARGILFDECFDQTVARLPALSFAIAIDGTTWASWLAMVLPQRPEQPVSHSDIAVVLYTSGTTGFPKGAMLTHSNLYANTTSCLEALQLRPGRDRILTVLPMFHAFAATVGMLLPLLHGLSFVLMQRFDPEQVCAMVAHFRCTVLPAVPSMFNLLLRVPQQCDTQLASLRYCISGGAALPPSVQTRFEQRFGKPILEGDGPTECGPVTCVNPVAGQRKPGSVGLPIPYVSMQIMDEHGQGLQTGAIGEICVRGPNVMAGYWRRPEATAAAFFGDWFRTGDLGYVDEDGYFFIVDRIKDLIIVNGMNVYPRRVEDVLYQYPRIAEAAVIGEPDSRHGEVVVAYVAPTPGNELEVDALRTHCRAHLGRHEIPRRFVIRDALPKNAAGKLLKRVLRRSGELARGVDLPEEGDTSVSILS